MKSIINQLCQLQDLILTRDEHADLGNGAHLSRLNESIEAMLNALPLVNRGYVKRLVNRDHVIVAPVHDDTCAVCGVRLPVSTVQAVKEGKALQYCPSCARVLYEDEAAPKWAGEAPSRTEPRKTGISRFSDVALMVPDLVASSASDAIEILAAKLEEQGFISHADKLITSALERESMLSTAAENGLAFPHVRGVEGGSLTLACGVSKEPFAWDAAGTPVNIVFLVVIPTAVSAFYMRLMAGLATAFQKAPNRKALIESADAASLWKALSKATRYTLK